MDSKTAEFLTKLMLEDDEDDVVFFSFPNDKQKIKTSISMLAEISPVFEAMFSTRWSIQKESVKPDDNESNNNQLAVVSQHKIIELDDDVAFNQYLTFKLLMQILYGLRKIDSLTVDQATGVYFYSHQYQIGDVEKMVQKFLNERMESGLSQLPFTVTELKNGIEFGQLYHLDEFMKKLDQVKLNFDEEESPIKFWELVNQSKMETLKQQVVNQLKTTAPKDDWPPELFVAIIGRYQERKKNNMQVLDKLKCCSREYFLYCESCEEYSERPISAHFSDL